MTPEQLQNAHELIQNERATGNLITDINFASNLYFTRHRPTGQVERLSVPWKRGGSGDERYWDLAKSETIVFTDDGNATVNG